MEWSTRKKQAKNALIFADGACSRCDRRCGRGDRARRSNALDWAGRMRSSMTGC